MESDSDDDSAASTATTERRAWELQGDEPQNEGNEGEPENDDDRNDENDEQDVVRAEEPTTLIEFKIEFKRMYQKALGNQLMRLRKRLDQ